jgi:hypothetical protein
VGATRRFFESEILEACFRFHPRAFVSACVVTLTVLCDGYGLTRNTSKRGLITVFTYSPIDPA